MHTAPIVDDYCDKHENPLISLRRSYFQEGHRSLNRAYISWLYCENPFGRAKAVYLEDDNDFVAFMALIPVALQNKQATISAYYAVDVLVDPKHQGRHLFSRLISAAKAFCESRNASLIGHPNKNAILFWKRAKMSFQETLNFSMAIPYAQRRGLRARHADITSSSEQLSSYVRRLATERLQLRVAACADYLKWRYLNHPENSYVIQELYDRNEFCGVQIFRRLRLGVKLLTDQFVKPGIEERALSVLPPLTICLKTTKERQALGRRLLHIPTKRKLECFHTPACRTKNQPPPIFGLSASDL